MIEVIGKIGSFFQTVEWHLTADASPDRDADVLVISKYDKCIGRTFVTVDNGVCHWNTTRDPNGKASRKYEIEKEQYIAWAYIDDESAKWFADSIREVVEEGKENDEV